MKTCHQIVFMLFITAHGFGQKTEIKGVILDQQTNNPIPFATIAVFNKATIIDGTSTAENGTFELEIKKEYTSIAISFIGYQTTTVQKAKITFPFIVKLVPTTNDLDEITITAERTTSQLKIDRRIINLGSDIQNAGTSALEAFDQIAEVQVDLGTGNLNLRGSANVRLLINGKPSSLNATEILEQLPSSSINRIELITTPSAKYQADGISGIINIILNKNRSNGMNLHVNSSLGTKRYSYGFEGNYNFSKLNFRINASQAGRRMNSEQNISRRYEDNSLESIYTPHDYNGLIRKINSGVDFFISDKDELSFQIDYTDDYHSFYNNSSFFDLTNRDDYQYLRRSAHEHETTIFNTNYRKEFSNENHYLEFDFNLNTSINQYPASDVENNTFLFDEILNEDFKLSALSFDYSHPIFEKSTIEAGISWNKSILESAQQRTFSNQTLSSNRFEYDEQLLGMYTLVKTNIGKLNLQTGLRYEYFSSLSNATSGENNLKLTFKNLFPSIHLSYAFNKNNSINLGYNKRISRPNFHYLNLLQLGNPYFRFIGNPNIEPQYSDNIESSYQYKKGSFNMGLGLFYRHLKNVIQRLNSIEGNVQTISFENFGTNDVFGVELNSQMKITPFWNTSLGVNYYHTIVTNNDRLTWNTLYASNIQLKNTFNLGKKAGIDITYRHTPKKQDPFFYILPRHRIDIAARAKFLKNRLITNIRVVDVLDNNLMKRFTVAPDFSQDETWRFQTQTFGVLWSIKYVLTKNDEQKRRRKKRTYIHENDIN